MSELDIRFLISIIWGIVTFSLVLPLQFPYRPDNERCNKKRSAKQDDLKEESAEDPIGLVGPAGHPNGDDREYYGSKNEQTKIPPCYLSSSLLADLLRHCSSVGDYASELWFSLDFHTYGLSENRRYGC